MAVMQPGSGSVVWLCDRWQAEMEHEVLTIVAEHVVLRALCDRLEQIADGLPGLPPAEERRAVCRQLATLVPQHHAREGALLETLLSRSDALPVASVLLTRIHGQHALDATHAEDLGAALEAAGGAWPAGHAPADDPADGGPTDDREAGWAGGPAERAVRWATAWAENRAGAGHAEALGYMLRCFFDGCRRALAFEELTLLVLARRHLSAATEALLMACLDAESRPAIPAD
ncbi:hypothetical protein M0638_15955 [Roseomonas sp. NAR14]|uniref:Hemerythrin-like domain-containing protein n=1 Tax=Roseomonas acroporae TaxID=2937791 RepID=A0A9X1Y8H9_9PROT|nr:hemerythrin domain-containing protein [Roseomonas acroporae]MCK8785874.1 hypothetical protein [Roseomonas acroporae]